MSQSEKPQYRIFRLLLLPLCLILSAFAICWDTAEVAVTEVYIDGAFCGWVDSAAVLDGEAAQYRERLDAELGEDYPLGFTLSYRSTANHNPTRLSTDDCTALIQSAVSKNYSEACMLYVNGSMTVAAKSNDVIADAVKAVEDKLMENTDGIFDKIERLSSLRTADQLCPNEYLRSEKDIAVLLNPMPQKTVRTADYSVRSLTALAPMRDSETVSSAEPILSYRYVKTETVEEVIAWQDETIEDDTRFVGYTQFVCEGTNGLRRVSYEIHYDLSGKETERIELVSEILVPAVNRTTIVGAKPIPAAEPTGTYIWPCEWETRGISSKYGGRDLNGVYDFHLGIDLPGERNSEIYAADGGKVIWAGATPSYGYSVQIDHGNGIVTLYAHLRKILVKVGDDVYQGQQIGAMGASGAATGVHLHFEVRIDSKTDDPLKYLPKVDVVIHD